MNLTSKPDRVSIRLLSITLVLFGALAALPLQAQMEPDFSLSDVNPNSARYGKRVSPRDYLLQVSAFYFGAAT